MVIYNIFQRIKTDWGEKKSKSQKGLIHACETISYVTLCQIKIFFLKKMKYIVLTANQVTFHIFG